MKKTLVFVLLLVLSQGVPAQDAVITDAQRATAQQLMQTALKSDLAYEIVESLTTEVGARLGGSEAEARARDWGIALAEELGFENIRNEEFTMPYWTRGDLTIEMTAPYEMPLYGTALGGSAASAGLVEAGMVYFRTLRDLMNAEADSLNGKVAFVDGDLLVASQTGAGYGPANQKRRIGWYHAEKAGASALVIRSVGSDPHRFPHTGMMSSKEEKWSSIPVIAVSNPDADHIRRLHNLGEEIEMRVASTAKWHGDVKSGNVVFELVGSERPDEIVLIGAHLDSWDLGTGALDDGAGIGITTAAAKLIADLPKRPKRTIRVVMFGAEEVGLLGAFAYAEKHKDQLDTHVVATESDFGARSIWQLVSNVHPEANSLIDEIAHELQSIGVIRGGSDVIGGGPDIIPLVMEGVPTIRLNQNGRDYFDVHHTPNDTLERIIPEELAQNVAAWAATIYLIADSDVELRPDLLAE